MTQKCLCIQNKVMNIGFQKILIQAFLDDYCQKNEAKSQSNNQMHFCCLPFIFFNLYHLSSKNPSCYLLEHGGPAHDPLPAGGAVPQLWPGVAGLAHWVTLHTMISITAWHSSVPVHIARY